MAGTGAVGESGRRGRCRARHRGRPRLPLVQKSGLKHAKLQHGVLRVKGTPASDEIALRLQAGNPAILQVDVGDDGSADFSFERKEIARIAVDARPGDDLVRIDDGNGAFTDSIPTTLDGDAGKDVLGGGAGAESLIGGDGDDVIDGNGGADTGLMGAGDDTFVWDPGDGSDVVEGQDGADTMLFNGAGGGEQVDLSANGNRLRFFRTQGAITMDTAGVERVDFNALGGADLATVNDLSGTDVSDVRLDLAATLGGATGDGQTDRVDRQRHQRQGHDHRPAGTRPVSPSQACRRSWRFSTRSRPTSSTSTASPATTRSTPPGLRPALSRSRSTAVLETTPWAEAPEPRA